MVCSKIVNLDCREAGLTSKCGRISPAVQWCYQNHLTAAYSFDAHANISDLLLNR